jgi:hypothetical protein
MPKMVANYWISIITKFIEVSKDIVIFAAVVVC